MAHTGFKPGTFPFPSLHVSFVPESQICDMALLIKQVGLYPDFKQKIFNHISATVPLSTTLSGSE